MGTTVGNIYVTRIIMNNNLLDHPIIFSYPKRLTNSAWIEHIPFAMLLIDLLRPKILVELGTHTGVSYCAFCQAIKQLGYENSSFAIDTWEGDNQAGFYNLDVLNELRNHHDSLYSEFSVLIKNTFDNALEYFSDGSIDLLHIDGLHTYEAVKHDYENWLPKISDRGVILFHDIAERNNDFGVWKLWEEVKIDYPYFELTHGHGLGLLAIGRDIPKTLDLLIKPTIELQNLSTFFFILGSRLGSDFALGKLKQEMNENQNIQLLAKTQALNNLRNQFENSRSWKITAPLRMLAYWARDIMK